MRFKEFWSAYRRDIFKLLTTHLALSVFSVMCLSPFTLELSMTEQAKTLLVVLITVLIFAFYYYLVRIQLWERGAKDALSAKGGRMTLRPARGLVLGALASVPSFLVNIVYLIAFFYQDYAGVQKLHAIFSVIELLWDAPALGLRLLTGSPFSYVTVSVLPMLFAGLGYFLGTKEFSLFPKKKN